MPSNFKLAISNGVGHVIVVFNDVLYVKGEGNYSDIKLKKKKKLTISKSLKSFIDMCGDFEFLRIHHSYIINFNHIIRYSRTDRFIELIDGTKIPFSRVNQKLIEDRLVIL